MTQLQTAWGNTRQALRDVRLQHVNEMLEIAKMQQQAESLGRPQGNKRVQESAFYLGDMWASFWSDRIDRLRYDPYMFSVSSYYDRRYGRFVPVYQTEQELNILRMASRILVNTNNFAAGHLANLTRAVVGTGNTFEPRTKRDPATRQSRDPSDYFADWAKDVWEEFQDRNGWYGAFGYENESFQRWPTDGECITVLWVNPDTGLTTLRIAEPEQMVQPPGGDWHTTSFGSLTPADDTQDPQAAWLFYTDHASDGSWHPFFDTPDDHFSVEDNPYVRVLHCKYNTPRTVKRGCPDFVFDCYDTFLAAAKLRRNLGQGAAVQAAYAIVREHEAVDATDVTMMADALADFQRTNPLSGNLERFRRTESATYDVPQGMKYVDPPSSKNGAAHIEILNSALLTSAGAKWGSPPWMGGGKQETGGMTSGANMEVVELPWLRAIEWAQDDRKRSQQKIFWQVLKFFVQVRGPVKGRSFEEIREIVECHCEPKKVMRRDPDKKAATDLALMKAKIKPPQQIRAEDSIDSDEADEQIREWEEEHGPIQPEPMAGPGKPGAPQGGGAALAVPKANGAGPRQPGAQEEDDTLDLEAVQEGWDVCLEPDRVQEDWRDQPRNDAGEWTTGGGGVGGGGGTANANATASRSQGVNGAAPRRPNPANPRLQDARDFLDYFKAHVGHKTMSGRLVGRPEQVQAIPVWKKMKADGMSRDKFMRLLKILRAHGVIELDVKDGVVTHIRPGKNHKIDLASLVGKPIGQAKEGFDESLHPRGEHGHWARKVAELRGQLEAHDAAEPPEPEYPDEPEGPGVYVIPEPPGEPIEPGEPPNPKDYEDPEEHEADLAAWNQEKAEYDKASKDYEAEADAYSESVLRDKEAHQTALAEHKEKLKSHEKAVAAAERSHKQQSDRWWRRKENLEKRLDAAEEKFVKAGGDLRAFDSQEGVQEEDTPSGQPGWYTLHGVHVYIGEGGKITKGPKAVLGKHTSELKHQPGEYHGQTAPTPKAAKHPETIEHQRKGLSKAHVSFAAGLPNVAEALNTLPRLFGPGKKHEEYLQLVASAVGAPHDARVSVTEAGKYEPMNEDDKTIDAKGIRVMIRHPKLEVAWRFIGVDAGGKKFVHNEKIEVKKEYQGQGVGTEIFSSQIQNAATDGFSYISTHAAGQPGETMNGYYTWPRLGYDESLESVAKTNAPLADKIRGAYPDAKGVQDVLRSEGGLSWWKENGGDLYDAKFDLQTGSKSRQIFDAYLGERSKKVTGGRGQESSQDDQEGGFENPDLSPEEEEVLDRVWERLALARAHESIDPRHHEGKAGHWVTINGLHVHISDNGTINTGPLAGTHVDKAGDTKGAQQFHGERAAHHRGQVEKAVANRQLAEKSGAPGAHIRGHATSERYHREQARKHEALARPRETGMGKAFGESPFSRLQQTNPPPKQGPGTRQPMKMHFQAHARPFQGGTPPAPPPTRKMLDLGKKEEKPAEKPPGERSTADIPKDELLRDYLRRLNRGELDPGEAQSQASHQISSRVGDIRRRQRESAPEVLARMLAVSVQEGFDPSGAEWVSLTVEYARALEGV